MQGIPPIPYQKSRIQKKSYRKKWPQARLLLHALMRRSKIIISAYIKKLIMDYYLGIKSKGFTSWKFSIPLIGSLCPFSIFASSSRHDGIFAFLKVDLSY
jgi:hypothetical protein